VPGLRAGFDRCRDRAVVNQQHTGDQCRGHQAGNTGGDALFKGEFHRVLPVQPKVKA
jgi:hypothetical protein